MKTFISILVLLMLSCSQNLNGVQKPIKTIVKILNNQKLKGSETSINQNGLTERFIFTENVLVLSKDTMFIETLDGEVYFNFILNDSSKIYIKNFLNEKQSKEVK